MKQLFILLFLSSVFSLEVMAQTHLVRGKITDETGYGVPGATITETDATGRVVRGTVTDFDGLYQLKFSSPNATANISYIGYKTSVVKINGKKTLNLQLETNTVMTGDAIVTASRISTDGNTNISDKDRSANAVNVESMKAASVTSIAEALEGEIPGLDIVGGGGPGSGASITIRGMSSLGNSSPLIVVDGIIQDVNTIDTDFGSADSEDIGMLVDLAPDDIKDIRVLKDASETSLYGAKGANGVIEITTLRGKKGPTKFQVSYKKSLSIDAPTMPMLDGDEYVMLQQEMWHNQTGITNLQNEIANNKDWIGYHNYAQNTDWVDEISRNGEITDYGFSLSGGGKSTTFRASASYQDNVGTIINTSNKRLTTRINLDYRISDKLNLSTQMTYTNINKEANLYKDNKFREIAFSKAPNVAIYEHDSKGVKSDEYFTPIKSYQSGDLNTNPSAMGALSSNDELENKFQTNFVLNYNINKHIKIRETVSFQFGNKTKYEFQPYTAIGQEWESIANNLSVETSLSSTLLSTKTQLLINAFSDNFHSLTASALWNTTQKNTAQTGIAAGGGPSVFITDPSSGMMTLGINSVTKTINDVGGLAQAQYKILDRYAITLSSRIDASSMFGSSYRWGLFPSVSAFWRFSDEPRFKELTRGKFNNGKLRYSYGLTGSVPEEKYAFTRHGVYRESGKYMNNNAIIPDQIELENLRWETTKMSNLGIELELFKRRINLTAELYNNKTEGIRREKYDIPYSSGYTQLALYNDGNITNKGWELESSVAIIDNKEQDLTVKLRFVISHNENKFTKLPANVDTESGTGLGNIVFPSKAQVGTPIGSFFGLQYLGVYPSTADAVAHNEDGTVKMNADNQPIPMYYKKEYEFEGGDAKYKDVNYDGVIDLNDVVYLGSPNPEYTGTFGFSVKYKNISANSAFTYRTGYQILNKVAAVTEGMTDTRNQSKAVLNRWRRPGQDFPNMLPRAYMDHVANNLGSDRYIEDGDYVRFNSFSISYNFDSKKLKNYHLDKLNIGFVARKIMTFTNYTGQDPEIKLAGDNGDPLKIGIDNGKVPPSSIYALNLIIGF